MKTVKGDRMMCRISGPWFNRYRRVSVFLALLTAAACTSDGLGRASAQIPAPVPTETGRTTALTYGLGGQLGYFKSSGSEGGAFQVGLRGRVRFGPILAFEGNVGYIGQQLFNFGKVNGADLSAEVQSVPVTVSLLLQVPFSDSFTGYVVGGGGLYMASIHYSADVLKVLADESSTKAGFQLGAGIEYPLNTTIGIHADYRYLFLGSVFSSNPQYDFSSKQYGGHQLTAGLMIYF